MDKHLNIFVQGAGKPDQAAEAAITRLGELLKEHGCRCHVGSKGAIPDILQKTGVPCARYAFEGDEINEHTWSNRLADWVSKGDAFVFFKGDVGTLAHLMPVLAFSKKMWARKGGSRKVALVGWSQAEKTAIKVLMGFSYDGPDWLRSFEYDQIEQAVAFLQ